MALLHFGMIIFLVAGRNMVDGYAYAFVFK